MPLLAVLSSVSISFSSQQQLGQSGQGLFFVLTGSPPRIASWLAFFARFPYAGMVLDAAAAREPAEAAAMNRRLVKSPLVIFRPFHRNYV